MAAITNRSNSSSVSPTPASYAAFATNGRTAKDSAETTHRTTPRACLLPDRLADGCAASLTSIRMRRRGASAQSITDAVAAQATGSTR